MRSLHAQSVRLVTYHLTSLQIMILGGSIFIINIKTKRSCFAGDEVGKVPPMLSKIQSEVTSLDNGTELRAAFVKVISSALSQRDEEYRRGENQILA